MSSTRIKWLDRLIEQIDSWEGDWFWWFLQYDLAWAFALGALGWYVAYRIEQRHLSRLAAREAEFEDISITQTPAVPPQLGAADSALLVASVVLSRGVFRTILITIRKLLGGRIPGYVMLVDRARREALVRLKADARARGAEKIVNLRLETTRISSSGMPVVEVVAYGTVLGNGPDD